MKKTLSAILSALLIISALAACGASPMDGMKGEANYSYTNSNSAPSYDEYAYDTAEGGFYFEGDYSEPAADSPQMSEDGRTGADFSEKMIYTAEATVETTEFEETVDTVYGMLEEFGAYLDSSSIGGKSYMDYARDRQTYRTATFVIRVPVANFTGMTNGLGRLGSVLNLSQSNRNITEQYYDAQSRLDTYRIEESRVLAMMEKADTVSDMIELESRLSDIRYEIESLESRLRTWQKQVDYSTVTLYVREVEKYTPQAETHRSYLQQLADSFVTGFTDMLDGLGYIVLDLAEALPTLVVLALFILVIVLIIRAIIRGHKKRKAAKKAAREALQAQEEKK